jgi:hypothetical protein
MIIAFPAKPTLAVNRGPGTMTAMGTGLAGVGKWWVLLRAHTLQITQ